MTPEEFADELEEIVGGSLEDWGGDAKLREFGNGMSRLICSQIRALVLSNEEFVKDEFGRVFKFQRVLAEKE